VSGPLLDVHATGGGECWREEWSSHKNQLRILRPGEDGVMTTI
jgi:hypothetical protein